MTASIVTFLAQASTTGPTAGDDDFAPGLLIGVLLIVGVCLLLIGIGIVVAALAAVGTAVLVGLGVLSSSALVAIASRRWSAGLRSLVYQSLTIAAAPCGVATAWVFARLFRVHLPHLWIIGVGLGAGAIAGLSLAFALDRIASFALGRLPSRFRVRRV